MFAERTPVWIIEHDKSKKPVQEICEEVELKETGKGSMVVTH